MNWIWRSSKLNVLVYFFYEEKQKTKKQKVQNEAQVVKYVNLGEGE